ncbi:MAG: nucleotidyltransferase, partial [Chloroflexi bacterium]|nr:nucleotidyltransferase [Chloroflexota bacterium]
AQVSRSVLEDSIVSEGAQIDEAHLRQSLIGRAARVQGGSAQLNIGDSSQIELDAGQADRRDR